MDFSRVVDGGNLEAKPPNSLHFSRPVLAPFSTLAPKKSMFFAVILPAKKKIKPKR